jgi:cytochrome c553
MVGLKRWPVLAAPGNANAGPDRHRPLEGTSVRRLRQSAFAGMRTRRSAAIGQKPPPRYTDALSHRAVAISESIRGLFVFRPGKRPMIRPLLLASCLTLATTALAQTPAPAPETAPAAAPAPAASTATPVGDAGRGKELTYTCQGCHGVTGYKNAYPNYHVPMIGGQSQQYLVNALTEYKQGARKHPTMQAQASSFSAQDIADIAAYISSLK